MAIQIRFTRNGIPVGDPVDNSPRDQKVNDIHITFKRGTGDVKCEYSKDGTTVRTRTAPPEAVDVGADFDWPTGGTFRIWRIYWTDKDGKRLPASEKDPDEQSGVVNDMHLVLPRDGQITGATWTHDGDEKGEVYPNVTKLDATDFHFGEEAHFPWFSQASYQHTLQDVAQRLSFIQGQLSVLLHSVGPSAD